MTSSDALKTFFSILAVLVGLPMIILMVRVGIFVGSLTRSVTALEKAADTFTGKVDRILEKLVEQGGDHETRLQLAEQFIEAERIKAGRAPDRRTPPQIPSST